MDDHGWSFLIQVWTLGPHGGRESKVMCQGLCAFMQGYLDNELAWTWPVSRQNIIRVEETKVQKSEVELSSEFCSQLKRLASGEKEI